MDRVGPSWPSIQKLYVINPTFFLALPLRDGQQIYYAHGVCVCVAELPKRFLQISDSIFPCEKGDNLEVSSVTQLVYNNSGVPDNL
jgi:hypothetical protein